VVLFRVWRVAPLFLLTLRRRAVGNVASAVDDGWSQFSSFLGGGLGGVFQHSPQPSPAATAGAGGSAGAARSAEASQRMPAGVLKNPLREHASDVPHSGFMSPQPGATRPLPTAGYSAAGVEGFMGSIGAPCVPSRDIQPAYMTVQESSRPGERSAAPPEPARTEAWAFTSELGSPLMQKPLGKLRAGDRPWTMAADEPSKPKGQIEAQTPVHTSCVLLDVLAGADWHHSANDALFVFRRLRLSASRPRALRL
jgi:hypothetical protein